MKKFLAATVAGLTLVAASYGLRALTEPGAAPDESRPVVPASTPDIDEVNRLIEVFEERVAAGDDALDQWTLGKHYLERASITGDVADYRAAREVLEIAYRSNAGNPSVDIPLASARLALHDFLGAARLVIPHSGDPSALAVLGDAEAGYGNVDGALSRYLELKTLAPGDPAVIVRLASVDWEVGDRDSAIDKAAEAALTARNAGFDPRSLAFYTTYHGLLLFESGRFDQARPVLEEAVRLDPEFLSPRIELAHVMAAQGELEEAIDVLEAVAAYGPDADVAVVLGNLYTLVGDPVAAAASYSNVEVASAREPRAYLRPLSLYLSDRSLDPARALALAEADLELRQDSGAYDTLAWALYRNERFEEARAASDRALEGGSSDPSYYFHAGMISLALGEESRGRREIGAALEMNPAFDFLQAPIARGILSS